MKNSFRNYRGIIAGIVFFSLGMVFYTIMQVLNLWAPPANHIPPFCEFFDPDKFIGEPINTWSNMFYVLVGMIVLLLYDFIRNGRLTKYTSYVCKKENVHYLLTYGLLVIWVGLGSFFMHGSYAGNDIISGHFFDAHSMNLYLSSVIFISLAILFDMNKKHFYILFAVNFIVVTTVVKLGKMNEFFITFLIITVINEFAISLGIYIRIYSKVFRVKKMRLVNRSIKLLLFFGFMFVSSYILWFLGRTDAASCDPYSWWQWHAYWHFGTAVAMLIIPFYILLEEEIVPSPNLDSRR